MHVLDLKYQAKYDEINRKRTAVISGQHEPTGAEVLRILLIVVDLLLVTSWGKKKGSTKLTDFVPGLFSRFLSVSVMWTDSFKNRVIELLDRDPLSELQILIKIMLLKFDFDLEKFTLTVGKSFPFTFVRIQQKE